MINKHWARWVRASCRKHFDDRKENVYLHFEGMDRDALLKLQSYAEFRIDGPHITEESRNYYRLDVAINLAISNKLNDTSIENLVVIAGLMQTAFTSTISIFKFGNGPDDNREALLGCLQMLDKVRFNNFGIVDETLRLEQATLEGRYRLYLTG